MTSRPKNVILQKIDFAKKATIQLSTTETIDMRLIRYLKLFKFALMSVSLMTLVLTTGCTKEPLGPSPENSQSTADLSCASLASRLESKLCKLENTSPQEMEEYTTNLIAILREASESKNTDNKRTIEIFETILKRIEYLDSKIRRLEDSCKS